MYMGKSGAEEGEGREYEGCDQREGSAAEVGSVSTKKGGGEKRTHLVNDLFLRLDLHLDLGRLADKLESGRSAPGSALEVVRQDVGYLRAQVNTSQLAGGVEGRAEDERTTASCDLAPQRRGRYG